METGENYLFLECWHNLVPVSPNTHLSVTQIPLPLPLITSELWTSFLHGG